MFGDLPLFLVASAVALYWGTVVVLVLAKRLRHARSAGLLPSHDYERRLWLLIVPVVVAWVLLPILAGKNHTPWVRLPPWASTVAAVYAIRWAAALLAVGCYLLSLSCWLVLGRRWSMAIVPGDTTRLVRRGLYRWVRHPIYGLSVALMLVTAVVTLTVPMAVVAGLHFVAMSLKAHHEEQHLTVSFGAEYEQYCREVGRFWPRWSAQTLVRENMAAPAVAADRPRE
jgi:protein-S-isoprenylcysteine O-methyltransferase Ste14